MSDLVCPHCGTVLTRRPLSKRQAEVLTFLTDYIGQHHYAPTFDEIAAHFDFSALSTVHEHLASLQRKGYIARTHNEPRGIQVVSAISPAVPEHAL